MGILFFIIALSFLIIVHEFGHFLVARRSGVRVEEFSLGFGPQLLRFKRGDTLYSIRLIFIGGYVKLYGEDGEPSSTTVGLDEDNTTQSDPKSFSAKSILTRGLIIVAGVSMNLVISFILLAVLFATGAPPIEGVTDYKYLRDVKIAITEIEKNSPAASVNIQPGDNALAIGILPNLKTISSVDSFQKLTKEFAGQEITLRLQRNKVVIDKTLTPRLNPPPNQGPLGVALAESGSIRYPWYLAISNAFTKTFYFFGEFYPMLFKILGSLFSTGHLGTEIAGPIGIAAISEHLPALGINYFLFFIALISINLASVNIFPFPALDGGRLLFIVLEKIKGSPIISRRAESMVHLVGFAVLIALILLISVHDVQRYL